METPLFKDLPDNRAFREAVDIKHGTPFFQEKKQNVTSYNDISREPRHAPYVSFGDQGTTATAGAFGSILRINKYIEREDFRSRILGLDSKTQPEAYLVWWRALRTQLQAAEPASGLGIRPCDENGVPEDPPTLSFLNNRWPVIKYKIGVLKFEVRLLCADDTILQHVRITNTSLDDQRLRLVLDPGLHMRDVDYSVSEKEDIQSSYIKGPHDHSVVIMEKQPNSHASKQSFEGNIFVVIGLFENGLAQSLASKLVEGGVDEVEPIPIERDIKGGKEQVDYIAAFKVCQLTAPSDWRDFIIQGDDVGRTLSRVSLPPGRTNEGIFAYDRPLSWLLRRNLEHILSVCSLRIQGSTATDAESTSSSEEVAQGPAIFLDRGDSAPELLYGSVVENHRVKDIGPVALTCGDFGDHRVSVSGSYFAFKFMLEMYKAFTITSPTDPDGQSLRRRIHETCKGHLRWIALLDGDNALSSNIWVNGNVITDTQQTQLPQDGPENIPLHILKVTDYLKVFETRDELIFVCHWLANLIQAWVEQLRQTRNRLTPTWSHPASSSDVPVYRLSDHVWIWKALADIEDLIKTVQKHHQEVPHDAFQEFLKVQTCLAIRGARRPAQGPQLDFTAEEMRRQNLRRFTLENDILRRRMLSVTRTARETRFLFHSRDTALYYAKKWNFFRGQDEVWSQLVNAQPRHDEEEQDEAQWDNALRYGLAIIMAASQNKLDRSLEPHEMYNHAKEILMQSSSENGLFPGQLDPSTKEPVLFDQELYRDFYFHCGFEVPFILLRYVPKFSNTNLGVPSNLKEASDADDKPQTPAPGPIDSSLLKKKSEERLPAVLNTTMVPFNNVADLQVDQRVTVLPRTLKRKNPYGKLVDLSNIVEVPEEWLYKSPEFLGFEPPQAIEDYRALIADAPIEMTESLKDEDPEKSYSFIEDIKKGRKQRKFRADQKSQWGSYQTSVAMREYLKQKRLADDAKKRFIYLKSLDKDRANVCYYASPDAERIHIAQFFDRHSRSDAYLYDDTSVPLNSWVTEMHFRFYQVQEEKGRQPISPPTRAGNQGKKNFFGRNHQLIKAKISFRIVGDFFDRYWTCHFIESLEDLPKEDAEMTRNRLHPEGTDWHQRKALELMLFCRIVKNVCTNARDVLDVEEAPPVEALNSTPDGDNLDHFENYDPEDLQRYLIVLRIFRNNLASLQDIVEQWKVRESSQGRGRPRWTRNDEQKYRKSIKHHQASLDRHIRNLTSNQAKIEILITQVTSAQEAIRSKKSLQQAENISLFTYVTVFFLPVGLAVSVFSMGDVPTHNVLISMVVTAIVALAITATVLYVVLRHIAILKTPWDLLTGIPAQGSQPQAKSGQNSQPIPTGRARFLRHFVTPRGPQSNKSDPELGKPPQDPK